MKKFALTLITILSVALIFNTCRKGDSDGSGVKDNDGNTYKTVTIGNQVWMAENLKTTKYRDGSTIPNIVDSTDWANLTSGAYCWYNNDVSYKNKCGALYNWYTIKDNRELCPLGWHIPSDAEWQELITFLGGYSIAGGKLKTTNMWKSPNTGADNSSGFSALPGGYCYLGDFYSIEEQGSWWSAYDVVDTEAFYMTVFYCWSDAFTVQTNKKNGLSVRCIKD
jgi:uncharacterized protein (TIGR02145 family)